VITIRDAKATDLPACVAMAKKVWEAGDYARHTFDEAMTNALGERYLNSTAHLFRVAEHDGTLIGFFMGYLGPLMFSPDLQAVETVWFVEPEYRKGGPGARMFMDFVTWGVRNGASEICVGVTTHADIDQIVGRSLLKRGFYRCGSIYKMDTKNLRA